MVFPLHKTFLMLKITYIQPDGAAHEVEIENGATLMEAAVQNDIAGIDADCGGACACATCHIYVAPQWVQITGQASEEELDMLDFTFAAQENSRLGCQIKMRPELDGLVVYLPKDQF